MRHSVGPLPIPCSLRSIIQSHDEADPNALPYSNNGNLTIPLPGLNSIPFPSFIDPTQLSHPSLHIPFITQAITMVTMHPSTEEASVVVPILPTSSTPVWLINKY
jgi:hypothetical protein